MKRKGLSMHTVAVISVGAAWLLSLVTLSLNVAGIKRWQGRASRLRSVGGLVMFTGALIDLLVHWPARPLVVSVAAMVLIVPGAACVVASGFFGQTRVKPPAGLSNGTTEHSGP